ncbi:hypothetical protein, partial [Pedobacter sp.]
IFFGSCAYLVSKKISQNTPFSDFTYLLIAILLPSFDHTRARQKLNGAVVWSNDGSKIAYNRYVKSENGVFLQIFLLTK